MEAEEGTLNRLWLAARWGTKLMCPTNGATMEHQTFFDLQHDEESHQCAQPMEAEWKIKPLTSSRKTITTSSCQKPIMTCKFLYLYLFRNKVHSCQSCNFWQSWNEKLDREHQQALHSPLPNIFLITCSTRHYITNSKKWKLNPQPTEGVTVTTPIDCSMSQKMEANTV